jgi:hypothetical protein
MHVSLFKILDFSTYLEQGSPGLITVSDGDLLCSEQLYKAFDVVSFDYPEYF